MKWKDKHNFFHQNIRTMRTKQVLFFLMVALPMGVRGQFSVFRLTYGDLQKAAIVKKINR